MTADEFKKELFWTFNLNLTKEGEAKLDKLIERITKARIEQKHIYITGRPKVRPSEEEVNGLINKYCEIHGTTYKDFFRQTGYRVGKEKISSARCDVCREIKVKYPHLVLGDIDLLIGKKRTNHTTIGYYLYSCKSITVNLPLQGAKYVKYKRHERKNQAA